MGLFDKVKAFKNAITGGAAEVTLKHEPFQRDKPFSVEVTAEVGDAPLKISRVYLLLEGIEEIDADLNVRDEDGAGHNIVRVEHTSPTIELKFDIAEAQTLEANRRYHWQTEVGLPEDAPPIYFGNNCSHRYRIQAGLDAMGNDPDSGWIVLT